MENIEILLKDIKLWNAILKKIFTSKKKIFLFSVADNYNMGDYAQSYCIMNWFNDNYSNYTVVPLFETFLYRYSNLNLLLLRLLIKKEDKIFVQSGYRMTDIYSKSEEIIRKCVKYFPKNKIVVLPQTIKYYNNKNLERAINTFNKHKDLTIMCRDEISYELAKKGFKKNKLLLYPDIVTTLIGREEFSYHREGIMLCLRSDKESVFNKSKKDNLLAKLNEIDKTILTDTNVKGIGSGLTKAFENKFKNEINKYAKRRIIVTDRYHGTIFSLIAGTPVLVLNSTDHKLLSGVKWFKNGFDDYVYFTDDEEKIIPLVEEIIKKEISGKIDSSLKIEYYDQLKNQLERVNERY